MCILLQLFPLTVFRFALLHLKSESWLVGWLVGWLGGWVGVGLGGLGWVGLVGGWVGGLVGLGGFGLVGWLVS